MATLYLRQRKVSEKLAEWLDEYNLISQRQQVYLRKIHDLRQGLLHKEDKNVLLSVDRIRRNPNHKKMSRRYPVYTLTKMEGKAVNYGPEPFPNRPCLLYDKSNKSPKIHMAPSVAPRKLAPIVQRVKTDKYNKEIDLNLNSEKFPLEKADNPSRPEMNTMRTEYEPFESIARRNKLNLNQFLNTSPINRGSNRRLPVQMSKVTIIDEKSAEDTVASPTYWNQMTINTRKSVTPARQKQISPTNNKQPLPALV